jgi:hypothetical protein
LHLRFVALIALRRITTESCKQGSHRIRHSCYLG